MKVGCYVRISEDPDDTQAGVQRQWQDTKRLAELRGWEPVEYRDNDLSAYKRGVVRPRFEQMLADLDSGALGGIVLYNLDRLTRQPRDLERCIDLYETRPGLCFATVTGSIDLTTDDGRMMGRFGVLVANRASADTARRVARKHLEIALQGRPVGGFRPFGWQADRATLDPKESAVVQRLVADLLTGRSLRSVVRELTEQGLTTTAGNPWSQQTLRQYLRNPRLVGLRTYRREVLQDDQDNPVRGLWEPMLDVDTWHRLQALLSRPETRTRVPRRGARHYLLTGILRCGVCQSPMYGNRRIYNGGTRHYYACSGTGHTVTASGVESDDAVTRLVLARLAQADLGPTDFPGEIRLGEITQQITEVRTAYLAKQMSASSAFPLIQALEEEQAVLRAQASEWTEHQPSAALSAEGWDALDTDQRRTIIEQVLEAVLVRPATTRGNRFDLSRLEPVWRRPGTTSGAAPV